jgi:hypothetical protein
METTKTKFEGEERVSKKTCCSSGSSEERDRDDGQDVDEMHWNLWRKE